MAVITSSDALKKVLDGYDREIVREEVKKAIDEVFNPSLRAEIRSGLENMEKIFKAIDNDNTEIRLRLKFLEDLVGQRAPDPRIGDIPGSKDSSGDAKPSQTRPRRYRRPRSLSLQRLSK